MLALIGILIIVLWVIGLAMHIAGGFIHLILRRFGPDSFALSAWKIRPTVLIPLFRNPATGVKLMAQFQNCARMA